jgi:hypothetical protein
MIIRRCLPALLGLALAATFHPHTAIAKETVMQHARGDFEVKLVPQAATPGIEAAQLGRQTIDKRFHGDLDATSLGEMLAVMDPALGSGAYVAIERVTGTLGGRHGSFVLVHRSTMTRGVPQQSVIVSPDSGTGELAGLSGEMTIHIERGQHSYTFDYLLP